MHCPGERSAGLLIGEVNNGHAKSSETGQHDRSRCHLSGGATVRPDPLLVCRLVGRRAGLEPQVVSDGCNQGDEVANSSISGCSPDGIAELGVVGDVLFGMVDGGIDV